MDDKDRPVDDAVRRLFETPRPSAAAKQHAMARLANAIEKERRRQQRGRRRLIPAAIGAIGLLIVTLLLIDSLQMTPARAALEEIASAVEQVKPQSLSDSEFLYLVSHEQTLTAVPAEMLAGTDYPEPDLVYMLNSKREVWYGNQGAVQIRTTNLAVDFFSPEAKAAYFEARLGETHDQLGVPTTLTVVENQQPDWPANPTELDASIRQAAQGDRSPEVEYLDAAIDIIRDPRTPPDVRAAALRLVSDLDRLEMISSTPSATAFGIDAVERGIEHRIAFTVTSDGNLRKESTTTLEADPTFDLPRGAQIRAATYSAVEVVDELP